MSCGWRACLIWVGVEPDGRSWAALSRPLTAELSAFASASWTSCAAAWTPLQVARALFTDVLAWFASGFSSCTPCTFARAAEKPSRLAHRFSSAVAWLSSSSPHANHSEHRQQQHPSEARECASLVSSRHRKVSVASRRHRAILVAGAAPARHPDGMNSGPGGAGQGAERKDRRPVLARRPAHA